MNIRQAEKKDVGQIEKLAEENGQKFENQVENTFVAEADNKIIGYICYDPAVKEDKWLGKHYETSSLLVKEEYLGEGVVTKLIEHLTDAIKSDGVNLKLKH